MKLYEDLYHLYFKNKEEHDVILEKRRTSESTYNFNFNVNEEKAFLFLHPDHFKLVSDIYILDSQISKLNDKLPSLAFEKYIKDTLISEIKSTNDIEGVISTKKEINDILEQMDKKKHDRLYGMVNRYNFLIQNKKFDLSTPKDIRVIYDELVSKEVLETDKTEALDGELFRANPVYLYTASRKKLHDGITPESRIVFYLTEALDFLNNSQYDVLIKMSVFHYLFGYIHPFYNGNGRVNRFITSSLISKNFTKVMGFHISSQIKQDKKNYYDAFEKTNSKYNSGDIGTFVYMFLKMIKKSFIYALEQLKLQSQKLTYYGDVIKGLSNYDSNEKNLLFVLLQQTLFSNIGIKLKELEDATKLSSVWVRTKIKKISEIGLITKIRDGHVYLYQIKLDHLVNGETKKN